MSHTDQQDHELKQVCEFLELDPREYADVNPKLIHATYEWMMHKIEKGK